MNETLPQHDHVAWIDTAKLVGIYLVILGHLPLADANGEQSFLIRLIYSFHMPLFFFLSGLVEQPRPPKETLALSAKNLLVPYTCFYIVTYPWWLVVSFPRHPELFRRSVTDGFIRPMLGLLNACGFDTAYTTMTNVPLWFLIALFWCRLFSAVGNARLRLVKPVIAIVGVAISMMLWRADRFLPCSFGAAGMAFPFYYAGTLLHKQTDSRSPLRLPLRLTLAAISFAVLVAATYHNGRVDMNGIGYGRHPMLFWLAATAGIVLVSTLCQLLPPLPPLGALLAQNTVTIVAFHSICNSLVMKVYAICVLHTSRLGEDGMTAAAGAGIALLSLLMCVVPCCIIRRYAPWMLGKPRKTRR